MNQRILLSLAHMGGSEKKYVDHAFETNWIVPLGPNVDEFEHRLAAYLNAPAVVALSAGTAAIHLGLVMLGVEPGDEVICQSMTFSASANPVKYCGANPVFVDSEPDTMNMDPDLLEQAIIDRKNKTGRYPKAIIIVHLYGMPAKIKNIMVIADKYGIPVLEDAAEALGSQYDGKACGTFGTYGALSFNGNKIITTSGGGALICPDQKSAERVKFLATQARENRPYYYHTVIGYNYRLSNVSAGIGCGQMEVLDAHLARRREIHARYAAELSKIPGVSVQDNTVSESNSNFWLSTISLDPKQTPVTADSLRIALNDLNIESRLLWRPMHMQPVFADAPFYGTHVSDRLFDRGLCLPSGSSLTNEDVDRVIQAIADTLAKA